MLLVTSEELINGKKVRVYRGGTGRPLIFLHGYPDNLQIWSRLLPLLQDSYQVIAFDWPGTGYSEEWPGGATPSHMCEKLNTLMDSWSLPRATIVGLDMGGQPALVMAAEHPERVDNVIVMNSLVFGDLETSIEIAILRNFGWNRLILRKLPWLVFQRALHTFMPSTVSLPAELERDLWESFKRPACRSFIAKMCAGYQGTLPSLPQKYHQIRCPVLILWAEKDKHFPLGQARRLHETIEGSQLRVLDGGEHWMCYYRADEIAEAVISFLAKL